MNVKRRLKVFRNFINTGNFAELNKIAMRLHPADLALFAEQLSGEELKKLVEAINREKAAKLFEELDPDSQSRLFDLFEESKIADIVQIMRADKIADFLGRIEPDNARSLKKIMTSEEAMEAYQLLQYPKESAGGIMSKDYIYVNQDQALGNVLKIVRGIFSRIETQKASYVYVVDNQRRLVGVLQMRDLVVNDPSKTVKEVMITSIITVDVDMDQESVANFFKKQNLLALPVVDKNGKLMGIVTADNIIDVIEQEMGEDMLKISGITSGDESHSMPLLKVIRKRLGWLSINILLNIVAASVIAFYQDTLHTVIALAVFLPIISDMSGCSGMQAVVVSVRELALGKIDASDFRRILRREVVIGLINGMVLGFEIGLVAYLWKNKPGLGLVVALALWINTTISVGLGSMLPLVLKKFKLDPAIASGPVLTTVTDMAGFFLVLFLATRFLWLLT